MNTQMNIIDSVVLQQECANCGKQVKSLKTVYLRRECRKVEGKYKMVNVEESIMCTPCSKNMRIGCNKCEETVIFKEMKSEGWTTKGRGLKKDRLCKSCSSAGCDKCGEFKPFCEIKDVDIEYEGSSMSMCFECRKETDIVKCETCPYLLCTGEDDDLDICALGYKTEENGIYCPFCVKNGNWAKRTKALRTKK